MAAPGSSAANKDFFEFVKAIGESKSKQEEDHIITEEILSLKCKLTESNIPKKKMKEILARALYVEMLGQDASFLYIKAVEMCASSSISQKRIGYLTASLFLSPEHEFRFMLVNQIQRDLNSSNILENCAALVAVRKIVTVDMIPAVLGDVLKLMGHEQELVRKHCLCALHRLYQMDPTSLVGHAEKIRLALCDRDPSVMGASLVVIHAFALNDAAFFKDLVPSFVSILKQVIEHRLPRDFDYHRIPAPWIQIQLLQLLALLGRGDQASSEGLF
jgi:AP-4 complex subunit epsilon-1